MTAPSSSDDVEGATTPRPVTSDLSGTALVVGAGFSLPAGLPVTSKLSTYFLDLGQTSSTPQRVQDAISAELRRFWETVFGFEEGSDYRPSFEDHFTALDLAANAGHNLGYYSPGQLRALRRLSIHRVFDILDQRYHESPELQDLLLALAKSDGSVLISTNWDVVAENHLVSLGQPYDYRVPGTWMGEVPPRDGLPLIKLHGSANWHYCDVCRSVDFGVRGKAALLSRTFLQGRDFDVLGQSELSAEVDGLSLGGKPCHVCHHRPMSARVATFSYSKAFDFFLFHSAWDAALTELRAAPFWTFVGYSLPDADFTFRHLLKTAESASLHQGPKQVRVVVGPDPTQETETRYRRFFGARVVEFRTDGVESWIRSPDGLTR